ncbi:MAG: polyprenyl synthetase family protein, partial [Mycobacteriales bacterium]
MTDALTDLLDAVDLRQRIQKALAEFLSEQVDALDAIGEELGPVGSALQEFVLDGGKRVRPAFCYWGWRGAGGPDHDEIVTAASALELVHAGALIHDDVMDASDTRRGRPAIHKRFEQLHTDSAWRGDARGFGTSAAILLGDLCLIWADQMLLASGLPGEALVRGRPTFDLMQSEVMAGQYLDVLEQARGTGSVESALRVARYKTAKYTIERPLQLGAELAGAGRSVITAYTEYGVPLGEAFQLRDDILGVFGDPAETGKPAGDDLREGKRTVLAAMVGERADAGQSAVLERCIGDPDLDDAGVAAVREIIASTGVLADVERMVAD